MTFISVELLTISYLSLDDPWIGAVTDVIEVKNLGLLSLKMSSLPWTDI